MRIFILAIVAAGLILGLVHGKCLKIKLQFYAYIISDSIAIPW